MHLGKAAAMTATLGAAGGVSHLEGGFARNGDPTRASHGNTATTRAYPELLATR